MTDKKPPMSAVKSYKSGHVGVNIVLKCGGYHDSAQIKAHSDLTTIQAREFAAALIDIADKADAKTASEAAAAERRKKYRDREVAAGRMVILDGLRG